MKHTQTTLKTTNPAFVLLALVTVLVSPIAQAQTPQAQPIAKTGSCPSGYTTSGGYCLAGNSAKTAIHKQGSCPSGWSTSGDYCLLSH